MSARVVLSFQKVESELRSEGYKGTHRVMRHMRELRDLLVDEGHDFESVSSPVKDPSSSPKAEETFDEALDNLD